MDTNKIIKNSSNNVSFAVYGCLNIEEGNYNNPPLESKESNQSTYSPNISDISSLSLSSLSWLSSPPSPSSSSSSSSIESKCDFSEFLVQLHIKRGLSKYYRGKSRTFRSLSDVRCLEDLSKKEIPHHKKKAYSPFQSPKTSISKKAGRSCFTSLLSKWS
uniref:Uncharacterized protein LOC101489917 n=1 Tax=Cicer arietinum TaxID=3827 RepID=A0A1S2Z2J3_CICAR|nr:uncharacterized protein LOC101489917 [Cicer arietinum]